MTTPALLVHGAWHGGWCWDLLSEKLADRGVPAIAVDLPMTGLADDIDCVEHALSGIAEPVILVGHSYGGLVITGAGRPGSVKRLVYIAALVLDGEETLMAAAPPAPPVPLFESIVANDDGTVSVDPARVVECFYADCPADEAAAAASRLRPFAMSAATTPLAHFAWKEIPSTYVLCTQDQAIHPESQRWYSARCGDLVELEASHSPFLSQPDAIAGVIARVGHSADSH